MNSIWLNIVNAIQIAYNCTINTSGRQFYQIIQQMMPPGVILPYGGPTAPPGFLLCNAAAVSRTDYANLFAAIGITFGSGDGVNTFNVPGSAALFLRGTGTQTIGGVVYTGPALGATQADAIQGHVHRLAMDIGQITNGSPTAGAGALGTLVNGSGSLNGTFVPQPPITDGANGTPRTAAETRPVSLGVNFIIAT